MAYICYLAWQHDTTQYHHGLVVQTNHGHLQGTVEITTMEMCETSMLILDESQLMVTLLNSMLMLMRVQSV